MKVNSYNGGAYFSITVNGITTYYTASGTLIPNSSPIILTLDQDIFTIGCVRTNVDCNFPSVCDDRSILSNAGACILTNSGDFVLRNAN